MWVIGVREDPERSAHEVIAPLMLAVLAQHSGGSPASRTLGPFWTEVARMGAYLACSHDGPASAGEPSGKAGSLCNPFLKAVIWLFISVCKM